MAKVKRILPYRVSLRGNNADPKKSSFTGGDPQVRVIDMLEEQKQIPASEPLLIDKERS